MKSQLDDPVSANRGHSLIILPASRISVVIPNFNRETLVGETIANLLAQTLPPHEIIVVDDGSTDHSVAVIRSFGDKVKLLRQANQGPGAARNAGLKEASGEFIQFQDSDDLYSRNKLEAQARLLEQTGADIAFSPWAKMRFTGRHVTLEDHVLQQAMPSEKISLPCWMMRGWSTVFQTLLFRRSFLDKVGDYRTDLMPSEDTELCFRILTSAPKVAFTPGALTLYRVHDVNKITQDEGTSRGRRAVDWARCLKLMIERASGCGLRPDRVTREIHLTGVRKHLRYLRTVPDAPVELAEYLSTYVARIPGFWLAGVEMWLRITEQMRLRTRGARWMNGYRSGRPTVSQLELIRELGFEIG
jgi:glycosyltransferase involved in cell wall biosynthesis